MFSPPCAALTWSASRGLGHRCRAAKTWERRAFSTPPASDPKKCHSGSTSIRHMPVTPQQRSKPMKYVIVIAGLALVLATSVHAQVSCKAQADQKKLAGAAQKSFMTKCEKDAKTACEKSAADKKLAGAAKASHLKKCVGDAVGS